MHKPTNRNAHGNLALKDTHRGLKSQCKKHWAGSSISCQGQKPHQWPVSIQNSHSLTRAGILSYVFTHKPNKIMGTAKNHPTTQEAFANHLGLRTYNQNWTTTKAASSPCPSQTQQANQMVTFRQVSSWHQISPLSRNNIQPIATHGERSSPSFSIIAFTQTIWVT